MSKCLKRPLKTSSFCQFNCLLVKNHVIHYIYIYIYILYQCYPVQRAFPFFLHILDFSLFLFFLSSFYLLTFFISSATYGAENKLQMLNNRFSNMNISFNVTRTYPIIPDAAEHNKNKQKIHWDQIRVATINLPSCTE